jgi:hypothetical protein
MTKIVYKIVRHDSGWAYQANGTFSETFRTRDEARRAARLAARELSARSESTPIDYEGDKGRWHQDMDEGDDRARTAVKG